MEQFDGWGFGSGNPYMYNNVERLNFMLIETLTNLIICHNQHARIVADSTILIFLNARTANTIITR